MKKISFLLISMLTINLFYNQIATAQDSVNVTFRHYPTSTNVTSAFVPGTFNNWGPNSSGIIASDAPSLMTYVDSLNCYIKIEKLKVGDTHNYKFHEHPNNNWITDPLNPLINTSDNNNSILNVRKTMIFEIQPKNGAVITEQNPKVIAGIYLADNDSLLLDNSTIHLDGKFISSFENNFIHDLSILNYTLSDLSNGNHTLRMTLSSKNGESLTDSVSFTYQGASPEIVPLPSGMVDGINYISDNSVTLVLHAPYTKDFVYVIGDFNDWTVDQNYFMKQTPDKQRFWLTINGLDPNTEYGFQYFVDGDIRLADPYAEKLLDPWNDQYISDEAYPGLISYPSGKTTEIVSVFQINQDDYEWQSTNFIRPENKDLVIYELLIRDFVAEHNYGTLIDSLDYFQRLGITAIELMPVSEFEGNESWGYNPSFYFAPDKYYGPKNELKRFIDECHLRGIAVILDMVLNHSYGQSPLVRIFSEGNYGPPSSENLWYNKDYDPNYSGYQARHPYNVGFDFNHESYHTRQFIDRVNEFWLEEYNVDGFRFDLTKGFTQRVSYSGSGSYNESLASQYDPSRIANLKRMADQIWGVDSTAYVILEHFTENSEEKELAEYGMMIWGNLNYNYNEATMGYHDSGKSNFSSGYYESRGWSEPHLVTYMESHDEERLMYKNLQYGNSSGSYSIKNLSTALDRVKMAAAFFFTLPGPKMIWQFGELGYDYSIDYNGRVGNKPIRWDYFQDPYRKNLYRTFAALINLRNENDIFTNPNSQVTLSLSGSSKKINISNDTMNVRIIGNFGVIPQAINPQFESSNVWYNYFYGDSIVTAGTSENINLQPGEFHIFTDKKLESPGHGMIDAINTHAAESPVKFQLFQNYPNPFNSTTMISYSLNQIVPMQTKVEIFNIRGQRIKTLVDEKQSSGYYCVEWDGTDNSHTNVTSGVYIYSIKFGSNRAINKLLLIK